LYNFDNDFHINYTVTKDGNWIFFSLVKTIEDEILDPLQEQADSFEDFNKLIDIVHRDHEVIDLFNDYHHEYAKAEEFAESLLNYTSDASIDSIMEVIGRSGVDYNFEDASPDVYESLMEIVKEKILKDNSQAEDFLAWYFNLDWLEYLKDLDSEFKEVLLEYLNNLEDEDEADEYREYLES